ncbi:pyrroloquinoline quinone biosynthesis peptide chaperone PqqD [Nordella sp. HKS 07]|nr:pyrroloquinoline quinone biosynthesis peptide chaperone PqqD [Nordella sp. HKS 07]QIG48401.1 pyrroloquinoline quinone biosynthesis peptide chaperone PqqD [Nordella sp. HKS 07]
MTDATSISGDVVPRLPRGVRLRYDDVRAQWMLLAPERILKPDGIALEILKRCDGKATLDTIIDDLARSFNAERGEIALDVREFLNGLAAKRMLDL